jgi:hypothetical protein
LEVTKVPKVVARPWRDTFLELKGNMAQSAALTLGTLAHFRHFMNFIHFILGTRKAIGEIFP